VVEELGSVVGGKHFLHFLKTWVNDLLDTLSTELIMMEITLQKIANGLPIKSNPEMADITIF
jgi:hypothetical protein